MPKKSSKKKKVALKDMSQTDGMAIDETPKTEPSTLNQVWGDDGTSIYKTMDIDVYEQVLSNMSKADLKNEATRVGLLPIDNMQQLKARLIREFKMHVSSYKRPASSGKPQNPLDVPDKIRKILEEGR
tara:strand:- start:763 stop:1146 length:384 start_codon:yes stop_codon:yes gene_type:complete